MKKTMLVAIVAVMVLVGSAEAQSRRSSRGGYRSHGPDRVLVKYHVTQHTHYPPRQPVVFVEDRRPVFGFGVNLNFGGGHHRRPVYGQVMYPAAPNVYPPRGGVYYGPLAPPPAEAYAPASAPPVTVVNKTNVAVAGDNNAVVIGGAATRPAGPVVRPVEYRPAVAYQVGEFVATTHDFKFVDPTTGRVMEVDADHKTGLIEGIEED